MTIYNALNFVHNRHDSAGAGSFVQDSTHCILNPQGWQQCWQHKDAQLATLLLLTLLLSQQQQSSHNCPLQTALALASQSGLHSVSPLHQHAPLQLSPVRVCGGAMLPIRQYSATCNVTQRPTALYMPTLKCATRRLQCTIPCKTTYCGSSKSRESRYIYPSSRALQNGHVESPPDSSHTFL